MEPKVIPKTSKSLINSGILWKMARYCSRFNGHTSVLSYQDLFFLSLGTTTGRQFVFFLFLSGFLCLVLSLGARGKFSVAPKLSHTKFSEHAVRYFLASIFWCLENIAVFSTVTEAFNKYSVHLWMRLLNPKAPRLQGMKPAGYKDAFILQPWLVSAQNICISSPFPKSHFIC